MKKAGVILSFVACLLIVLAMIPQPPPPAICGRVGTTKANLMLLHNVVSQFRMDAGRLPTATEGLNALIQRPAGVQYWETGGYLETTDMPIDGWMHEFIYVLDPNLPGGFGIYSCGEDGVTSSCGNDRDDLNTWGHHDKPQDYYDIRIRREKAICWAALLAIPALLLLVLLVLLWKGLGTDRKPT